MQTAGEILNRFYLLKYLEVITESDDACQRVLARYRAEGIRDGVEESLFARHCVYNVGKACAEALLNGRTLYVFDDGDERLLTNDELMERVNKAYQQARQPHSPAGL
jgi:hypothetical protein